MATHPSILPWKSHGQRSPVGFGPWGQKESDVLNWWSTSTWAWWLKETEISPGDTEKSTGIIPESPGQLNEFILQDKLWVCVWMSVCLWGSMCEGVCLWGVRVSVHECVSDWIVHGSVWNMSVCQCVCVQESARECVYERVWVGGNTYVSVTTWVCVNVCERVCFYVRVSVCVCTLALEVPVIVVSCRCNKMSCMQWLETTQTYYLLFLKVNDLKIKVFLLETLGGGPPPLAFSSLQRPPPFLQPFFHLQSQQWQAGSFSQQILWPVLPPLFYF